MDTNNFIRHKSDGTYIIQMNGYDFHVTPEYPSADQYGYEMTYEAIKAYADAHPEEVTEYQEPVFEIPDITPEQHIATLEFEAQKLLPTIQAGIDVDYNQQRLIDVMLEIEELKGNLNNK